MANSIELAKVYVPILDAIYKAASKTSVLDAPPQLIKAAAGRAGAFLVPQLDLVGLGDYDRSTGYPAGDVSLAWVEHTYACDRGRTLTVDAMDDQESMNQAFGLVAGEFMRTHVIPEMDAYRIAKLASTVGVQGTSADLETAAEWVAALEQAKIDLADAEVDDTNLVLFITERGRSLVTNAPKDEATTDLLQRAQVVVVPTSRMWSEITLDPGATADAGGWEVAAEAVPVNFLLLDKGAAFVDTKHELPRIFDPSTNQAANAWKFDYRVYHDAFVWEKKVEGIYSHLAVSTS